MDGDVLTHLIDSISGLQSAMLQLLTLNDTLILRESKDSLQDIKTQIEQQQAALLHGAAERRIAVERLDIEEPDGTTRLAISNRRQFPKIIVDGQTYDERKGDSPAGLIFYDDEGSECGGLVYGGKRDESGDYAAGGSLTLDQFRQDQVIGLQHDDVNGQRVAGLKVWDRPSTPVAEWMSCLRTIQDLPDGAEKTHAFEELRGQGFFGAQRIFVGKWHDGNAVCGLFDGQGHARLRMVVQEDGAARIDFLDTAGAVIKTIGPDPSDCR